MIFKGNKFRVFDKKKILFYSLIFLGVSHVITQISFIREFTSIFYGNEIVIGIILANWMLLSGIGSYIGKCIRRVKEKTTLLIIFQILIAVMPLLLVLIIRCLKGFIIPVGVMINITYVFLISFLILLPYCFISGFLLVVICCMLSKESSEIGKVYLFDNIGDIIGGLLFSFLLIYIFNTFQSLYVPLLLNLSMAFVFSTAYNKDYLKFLVVLTFIFSFICIFVVDIHTLSTNFMFRGQKVIFQKDSPFGNLVVTKMGNQLNFFENGIPLFTTDNIIENEETVHYVMSQHKNPKRVLLISGGISGTLTEILKYNVEVDYVELDPMIIDIGKRFTTTLNRENINVITTDGRLYVKTTKKNYDVVILDISDPTTAQLNRFYTLEFFEDLKTILNPDGVVSLSISSSENYMNVEIRKLNSAIYKTLNAVFKNIIIIPGDKNYFIASDTNLSYDINSLLEKKNIETVYVKNYLSGKITEDRIASVNRSLNENVGLNRDFFPISYYYDLLYWSSHFRFNLNLLAILFIIAIVVLIHRSNVVSFSIFTTGFTATSLEMVLIIAFQIIYGYIYSMVGMLVTMFFGGLAIGSSYMSMFAKNKEVKDLVKLEISVFIYALILPLILISLKNFETTFLLSLSSKIVFPLLIIIIALLAGLEFPLASKLHSKDVPTTAGELYYSDFMGGCIGAMLTSTFLIPLLGIIYTCLIVGAVNIISILALKFKFNF